MATRRKQKPTFMVVNHKGEILDYVVGGRGIKNYLLENHGHAIGNGYHRIAQGEIVSFCEVKLHG